MHFGNRVLDGFHHNKPAIADATAAIHGCRSSLTGATLVDKSNLGSFAVPPGAKRRLPRLMRWRSFRRLTPASASRRAGGQPGPYESRLDRPGEEVVLKTASGARTQPS